MAVLIAGTAIFYSDYFLLLLVLESFFDESLFLAEAVVVEFDLLFGVC